MIDKAKESKKPIVLISGDVKDDWWLKRDGKRIMPLPQLKKEMLDKSGVDFHIYTADRFLELYKIPSQEVDEKTIKEVRKIRELEEERLKIRMEAFRREREFNPVIEGQYFVESIHLFEILQELMMNANELAINSRTREELNGLFHRIRELRNKLMHGEINEMDVRHYHRYTKDILFILDKLVSSIEIDSGLSIKLRRCINRIGNVGLKLNRYRQ
jgi:hypothetical protein